MKIRCLWLAALLAGLALASTAKAQVNVVIQNQQAQTIYVAFTLGAGQAPGALNWGNCSGYVSNNQAALPSGTTCNTVVPTSSGSSRFCASTSSMGTMPNCYNAQTNHQTLVETAFGSGSNGCTSPTMASCVWHDISVIPANCTDQLWVSPSWCSNTGGAAYNLPVTLSCAGQPTFTCQGPPGSTWGNSNYPSKCGNPNATCEDRKSTRLNSSHSGESRMPSSA